MLEAVVALTALSHLLFAAQPHRVLSGLPLGFAALGIGWSCGWLPPSVYPLRAVSASAFGLDVARLVLTVDALQFGVHWLTHRCMLSAHAQHHVHRAPSAGDAFRTGALDGLMQLIAPIWVALWMWRPSRLATSAFGVAYGLWLQWIHSDDPAALAKRSAWFVTPAHHRVHHQYPRTNYGHVLRVWDRACGTDRSPRRAASSHGPKAHTTHALPRLRADERVGGAA